MRLIVNNQFLISMALDTGQHEFEAYLEMFAYITSHDVQCSLIGTEYLSVG